MATIQAMKKDRHGNITKRNIEESINENIGNRKTEIIDDGEKVIVKFIDSNRYYEIDNNGNIKKTEIIVDTEPGNIKIGINGENLYGTEISPFEIWCIEDLIEWSQNYKEYVNSYIKLCRTLDFKSTLSYTNSKDIRYGDINGDGNIQTIIEEMQNGKGFIPIDNFSGIFEGNNYEINNMYQNIEGHAGLFKGIDSAIINNLGISGNITGTGDVGAISGSSNKSTIQGCWNKAKIVGNNVGGILGVLRGNTNVINCCNLESITGKNNVGGITGWIWFDGGKILNCYNQAPIATTTSCNIGGILGTSSYNENAFITNCYNAGEIDKNTSKIAGSICGYAEGVKLKNVYYVENKEITGVGKENNTTIDMMIQYTKQEMQSEDFVNELNNYITNQGIEGWEKWKTVENSYPTFEKDFN